MNNNEKSAYIAELIEALPLPEELDLSAFYYSFPGIGHNELRYLWVNQAGEPCFESNNVHVDNLEDSYKVFKWNELTDYEKEEVERILKELTQNLKNKSYIHACPYGLKRNGYKYIVYKVENGICFYLAPTRSLETAHKIANFKPNRFVCAL